MNISKLALTVLLAGALMAFGCDSGGGNGGTGGAGGAGGTGGGGNGGDGGNGGTCEPVTERCASSMSTPFEPCCELEEPPTQENACDGSEPLDNPESCDPTGETVTHQLTVFALDEECNNGFDLDGCDGNSCANGELYAGAGVGSEGINGVDNGLASSGPPLNSIDQELDSVQRAFSNSMCGRTDDPELGTCDGGDNDGEACTMDDECGGVGATCDLTDDDCLVLIPAIDITFEVDANLEQNCANVKVRSGDESVDVILNLSAATETGTVCASGTIGSLPIVIEGTDGTLGNGVVRMTVSANGFSDGLLGVTADQETAMTIAAAIGELEAQLVGLLFDINEDLSGDPSADCNALSMTFAIGGVAGP